MLFQGDGGHCRSAIKVLTKAILVEDRTISRILEIHLPEARGNLASGKGLGADLIEKFLQLAVSRLSANNPVNC